MNTIQNTIQTVTVNGREVLDFSKNTPNQCAILPLSVVKRLATFLNDTNLDDIKRRMVRSIKADLTNDMQSYLNILQEEIDFHTTITALMEYKIVSEEPVTQNTYL